MRRQAALRRELPASVRIPYRTHVSPHLVRTEAGDYVQVFRLAGASFESVDDDVLNNWHERLNVLWRNIASANTALWVHVVRRREVAAACSPDDAGFRRDARRQVRQAPVLRNPDGRTTSISRSCTGRSPARRRASCRGLPRSMRLRRSRPSARMPSRRARSWRRPLPRRSRGTSPSGCSVYAGVGRRPYSQAA